MNDQELLALLTDRQNRAHELIALNDSERQYLDGISIRFNGRLSTTAGMWYAQIREITINPLIVEFDGEIVSTIDHELSHAIISSRGGNKLKAHGKQWHEVMVTLGYESPKRCHSMPLTVKRRKVTRIAIYCRDCRNGHSVSLYKWRRMRNWQNDRVYGYRCSRCYSMNQFAPVV
jgi:predicted SprT family Zn-dependent metalloprotease